MKKAILLLALLSMLPAITCADLEFLPDISDILDEILKAPNDREVNQDLIDGINLAIPHGENVMINVGAHRTNPFASDISSDRDAQRKIGSWPDVIPLANTRYVSAAVAK
jgi:hypothetical protein